MQSYEIQPQPALRVRDLCKTYPAGSRISPQGDVHALVGATFDVNVGESLGIVGESGSGKSTLGRIIAGLIEPSSGQVLLDGQPVHGRRIADRRHIWRRLQMIFQDPYSSLNPRMTVEEILLEPLRNFGIATGAVAKAEAVRVLDACGLGSRSLGLYPSAFSGGQRQRIGIARALIIKPSIIVADEPVSALDVSVQAQIVNLLMDLQKEFKLTYLFIGHDLAVVRHIADRVAVMNKGKIVELSDADEIFMRPQNDYTRLLLASSPIADPIKARAQLYSVNQ